MSAQPLIPGQEIERDMEGDAVHRYALDLDAGHFLRVVAEQRGLDVALDLYDPTGVLVFRVDSPTGRQGAETLIAVAETAGTYHVDVRGAESTAPRGRYRLSTDVPRVATEEDRRRATAERFFSEAEEARRQNTPESVAAAIEGYQEALYGWRSLGDRQREADTLERIGWAFLRRKEYGLVREPFGTALGIYRDMGLRHGEAFVLNSFGALGIQVRDYDATLRNSGEALRIAREIGDHLLSADCLNNLGLAHRRLNDVDEALAAYREALGIYESENARRPAATARTNLGNLYALQGKLDEAADHLQAAVATWESLGKEQDAANALTRLGKVRRQQGDFESARDHCRRALELRRTSGDKAGEAATLNALGTAYLLLGDHPQARTSYLEALAIFRQDHPDPKEEAVVLVNLGRLENVQKHPAEALARHREAAPLIERSGDPATRASNLYGMARAHHDLGDFAAARELLRRTVGETEELRTETASEGLRIAFFATRQHYYELYVDVLMHLGETATAFEAAEWQRARALLDLLGEKADEIRQDADPELLRRELEAQEELNALDRRRWKTLDDPDKTEEQKGQELQDVERLQREARLEIDNVRTEIRRQSPRHAELTRPSTRTLEDVQKNLLGRHSVLLAYAFGDERSFLWVVTPKSIDGHVLDVTREAIERVALRAHRQLQDRDSVSRQGLPGTLASLSETLLAPAADVLAKRRTLLVVAEGALLYVPFGALPRPGASDGELMIQKHEIVHGPSASVLLTIREERRRLQAPPQDSKLLAIFADPDFQGTWKQLPGTRSEAEGILTLIEEGAMKFFGEDASKERILRGDLQIYQILHFATHGELRRDVPELSGLILAHGDRLAAHEIYNLSLPAELAVLSACSTGDGEIVRGEGILGLTRAFMYAGTSRLVVSLWDVDDGATAELMERFYWSLLRTPAPPAVALRAAQLSMLAEERWQHPSYWSGFVFQGDWRRPGRDDVDDQPFEEVRSTAAQDDEAETDYPGPGLRCEKLPEPWQQELCRLLNELGKRGSR